MQSRREPTRLRRLVEFAASEALSHAVSFEFPNQAPRPTPEPVSEPEGFFIGIVPLIQKALIIAATATTLLISSIGTYWIFYCLVMPGPYATKPLYFDYSGVAKHPALECTNEQAESHEIHPGAPWAVVDLFSKHIQWEPFQPDVIPKPIADERLLNEGGSYYLEVSLSLPESELNRRNGMFGVLVELQSTQGERVASSIRAARLPHETIWGRNIGFCLYCFSPSFSSHRDV